MVPSLPRFAARAALLPCLIAAAASCSALGFEGAPTQRAELERQKAKWVQQHLSTYRFSYRVDGLGLSPGPSTQIDVRGDVVESAVYLTSNAPVPVDVTSGLPTVDALFRIVEQAIGVRADLLEVTYHPVMGYPMRIAVDQSFNTANEEVVHTVGWLVPLSPE